MDIRSISAKNLKKYRSYKLKKKKKVAELCGLHRTYISDVECKRRSISLDNIQKISDALQVEVYKLFLE